MDNTGQHGDRILRLDEVASLTGLSRSSVKARVRAGDDDFPRPRQIGQRALGWLHSDIVAWMHSRPVRGGRELGAR